MASEENFKDDALCGATCGQKTTVKKPWHAPQLDTVSIASLTEFMGNPGTDGTAAPSLS